MKTRIWTSFWVAAISISLVNQVLCAPGLSAPPPKGRRPLLNSYLPAAMQVLAHLTNQMKFERQEVTTSKPVTSTTTQSTTTTTTTITTSTTKQPETTPEIISEGTTTPAPVEDVSSTTSKPDETTPSHSPGIFAPVIPPNPEDEKLRTPVLPIEASEYPEAVFLPYQHYPQNSPIILPRPQHEVIQLIRTPQETFPLLVYPQSEASSVEDYSPFYIPANYQQNQWSALAARSGDEEEQDFELPDLSMLPVVNEDNFKYNPLELEPDELSEENLQYLSPNVREVLRSVQENGEIIERWNPAASFQSIEDLFDDSADRQDVSDWLRLRKTPPSQSLIQMLLLYDLFSRDAKKQKLNNYHGYTKEMEQDLAEISNGTAGDQLKAILQRMLARGDCTYDFANNRAKEMVAELEKPDSRMSNEIRYLEPLRYTE